MAKQMSKEQRIALYEQARNALASFVEYQQRRGLNPAPGADEIRAFGPKDFVRFLEAIDGALARENTPGARNGLQALRKRVTPLIHNYKAKKAKGEAKGKGEEVEAVKAKADPDPVDEAIKAFDGLDSLPLINLLTGVSGLYRKAMAGDQDALATLERVAKQLGVTA